LAIVGSQSSSRGDYTKNFDDQVIEHGVASDPHVTPDGAVSRYINGNLALRRVSKTRQ
jgi:hypothetical protein